MRRVRWFVPALLVLALALAPARGSDVLAQPAASEPLPTVEPRIVFDGRSQWNRVIVADQGELRSLYFDSTDHATQSTVSLGDPRSVPMEYIRHAASALAFTQHRRSLLVVGLGGGTFPMLMRRAFPAMAIDVVELDALVRKVAIEYFGVVEDAKLKVHVADGAAYLKRPGTWDLVMLDAYGADAIPEALATDDFFADVARRLAPGGLVIANVADAESSERERAIIGRLAKRFPACVLQHTPRSDNVIVVAGAALPKDLARALKALEREHRYPFEVAPMAARYHACVQ